MRPAFCILISVFASCALAQTVEWSDDFAGYPEGSDGAPKWSSPSIIWEVRDGAYSFDGPMTTAFIAGQPRYERLKLEATVVLTRSRGTDWKIAGLAAYGDSEHFWHLALVEAPQAADNGHFCELSQRFEGKWPSGDHVRRTSGKGGDFDWQYGTPYKLQLDLDPGGIRGRIWDPAGNEVVNIAYEFTGPAGKIGRPGLRASQLVGSFDDVRLTASGAVPDPPIAEKTYPAYAVSASDLPVGEATGFFRTERRDDRWWVIDPMGRPFYAIGTDHCRFSGHWCQELGYAPYGKKNAEKWDGPGDWAVRATDRLKAWNFNLLGAGNGHECRYKGLAHTDFISFGSAFSDYDDICPKTRRHLPEDHVDRVPQRVQPQMARLLRQAGPASLSGHQ